ncbi:MAG: amidohydrolase family protein, partial [Pirellula sp.]
VRWLVDMTTQPWDPDWLAADRRMVVQPCIEMMDVLPERYDRSRMFLEEQCASTMPAWIGPVGLAPHAPYTTSLNVTRRVADRSQQEWRLVSMHLAESRDEMQWLANGTGPFSGLLGPLIGKEFVNSLGSVSEHLVQLEHAHRVLVVHGNYLSVSELDFMAKQSSSFRLVHCPRTHRFFGHTNDDSTCYPLVERVSAGVGHLIGTDSRASNPDLNLWCEAQFLRATHAQLSSLQILRMISLDAIEFLGIADHVGTLSAGRPSSLTCVRAVAPDADENSILDAVLGSSTVSSPIESVVG